MTLGIPSLFPPRGELINFDWRDIASGTGIIEFFGSAMTLSGTVVSRHLVEEIIDCGVDENHGYTQDPEATLTFDTVEFIIPRTVKGIAYVSIPLYISISSGQGADQSIDVTNIKLIQVHVGGSTTDLTNEFDLETFTETATGGFKSNKFLVVFNSISSTVIKKGEKIRLSMDVTGEAKTGILHNPTDRDLTINDHTIPDSRLSVHIPFALDI